MAADADGLYGKACQPTPPSLLFSDPLTAHLPTAARLDAQGAEWVQRCDADKAAWATERARLLEEGEARLAEVHRSAAAAMEEAQQRYKRKMAEAEAKAAAAVQATERWVRGAWFREVCHSSRWPPLACGRQA